MRLGVLFLVLLVSVSCSQFSYFANPIEQVTQSPMKTLVYEAHELPTAYQRLIKTSGNMGEIQAAFDQSNDEYVRYSLALIVYEKTTYELSEKTKGQMQKFFQQALSDKFDWVKSKAVWGLSRVGSMNDFAALIDLMSNEQEKWLEDDIHAALAMIRDRSEVDAQRKPASASNIDVNFYDTKYWKRWWSKNSKNWTTRPHFLQ